MFQGWIANIDGPLHLISVVWVELRELLRKPELTSIGMRKEIHDLAFELSKHAIVVAVVMIHHLDTD